MPEIQFVSDVEVELVDVMGNDSSITQAARVSTVGATDAKDTSEMSEEEFQDWWNRENGLIGYLMKHRHGSPFEQATMKFHVTAPIFVFREFMRHRIASYNEISGRYSKLQGRFYIPDNSRPMVNAGSSARPSFEMGTQHDLVQVSIRNVCLSAWKAYHMMLDAGVANEVARMVLPVNLISEMYVVMNLRSLMNFLSLRTHVETATVVSNPQLEIQMCAAKMEDLFTEKFPMVANAFEVNGRVAP